MNKGKGKPKKIRPLRLNEFLFNGRIYSHNNYSVRAYNGITYISRNDTLGIKSNKPKSSSRKAKTSGFIYCIKCTGFGETFIKVGYTNNTIKNRFKNLPYQYILLGKIAINKIGILEYEQSIHSMLKDNKYSPKVKFVGYTECYTIDKQEVILRMFFN
jgi:hypothetical protein